MWQTVRKKKKHGLKINTCEKRENFFSSFLKNIHDLTTINSLITNAI